VLCALNASNVSTAAVPEISFLFNLSNFWVGFPTEEELVLNAMPDDKVYSVLGGVVFYDMDANGTLPLDTRMAIRFQQFKVWACGDEEGCGRVGNGLQNLRLTRRCPTRCRAPAPSSPGPSPPTTAASRTRSTTTLALPLCRT
jgi:hypothetical protein